MEDFDWEELDRLREEVKTALKDLLEHQQDMVGFNFANLTFLLSWVTAISASHPNLLAPAARQFARFAQKGMPGSAAATQASFGSQAADLSALLQSLQQS